MLYFFKVIFYTDIELEFNVHFSYLLQQQKVYYTRDTHLIIKVDILLLIIHLILDNQVQIINVHVILLAIFHFLRWTFMV
jgi:hypothetical protein